MIIQCENCQARYEIDDIQTHGKSHIKTQCPKCHHIERKTLIADIVDVKKSGDGLSLGFEDDIPTIGTMADSMLIQSDPILPDVSPDQVVNNKKLYNGKKGNQFLGPFTLNEMEMQIRRRKVSKEWLFAREGEDWVVVEEIPELLPFFDPSKQIKERKEGNGFFKYFVILLLLGGLGYGIFYFFEDGEKLIQDLTNQGINKTKTELPLDGVIATWKQGIKPSKKDLNKLYLDSVELFYQHREDTYIQSAIQFKEILIRSPKRYDAFYHLILAAIFSTSNIEPVESFKKYADILKGLKEQEENNPLYLVADSVLHLKLKNFNDALYNVKEAIKRFPDDALAYFVLGRYYRLNEESISLKYLEKSSELNPKLKISSEMLSESYLHFSEYKKGVAYYKNRKDPISRLTLSKIYLKIGYYKEALGILKRLSRVKKKRLVASEILRGTITYQIEKKYKRAFRIFASLEKKSIFFRLKRQEKIEVLKHLAIIMRLRGEYQKSIKYSEHLFQLDKGSQSAAFNLSIIYSLQKKFAKSQKYILQLEQKMGYQSKEVALLQFELHKAKGDFDLALKSVSRLIMKEPHNNIYYLLKAETALRLKDYVQAYGAINGLNSVDPDYYTRNYLKLSDFFVGTYQPKWLLDTYEKRYKTVEVDHQVILNNLGLIYYQLRKYPKSLKFLNKAIEADPRNYSNYLYRAFAYYRLKSYKQAIYNVDTALRLNDSHPFIYYIGTKAALKMKKNKLAEKYLTNAEKKMVNSPFLKLAKAIYLIALGSDRYHKEAVVILKKLSHRFKYDFYIRKILFSSKF